MVLVRKMAMMAIIGDRQMFDRYLICRWNEHNNDASDTNRKNAYSEKASDDDIDDMMTAMTQRSGGGNSPDRSPLGPRKHLWAQGRRF